MINGPKELIVVILILCVGVGVGSVIYDIVQEAQMQYHEINQAEYKELKNMMKNNTRLIHYVSFMMFDDEQIDYIEFDSIKKYYRAQQKLIKLQQE